MINDDWLMMISLRIISKIYGIITIHEGKPYQLTTIKGQPRFLNTDHMVKMGIHVHNPPFLKLDGSYSKGFGGCNIVIFVLSLDPKEAMRVFRSLPMFECSKPLPSGN